MAWSGLECAAGVASARAVAAGPVKLFQPRGAPAIPAYLRDTYRWAYLNRRKAQLLDREAVVAAILLGNQRRLRQALMAEIAPGARVLQAAHVYGNLVPEIAHRIGPAGRLDVIEVAPLQAALCRRKLANLPWARVTLADAAERGPAAYDVVSAFFLLHEMPDAKKRAVVDALLARVKPGGRAVFIDYHRPSGWHPLRTAFRLMFDRLEPYAESLWHRELRELAADASLFRWDKRTLFGGLYQVVVAHRP